MKTKPNILFICIAILAIQSGCASSSSKESEKKYYETKVEQRNEKANAATGFFGPSISRLPDWDQFK